MFVHVFAHVHELHRFRFQVYIFVHGTFCSIVGGARRCVRVVGGALLDHVTTCIAHATSEGGVKASAEREDLCGCPGCVR